jgi:hypothetical protein
LVSLASTILSVVSIAAIFGVGFSAGLLGHLNLPAGRRAAATFLGNTLVELFQGQVSIGSITKVSPEEVVAEDGGRHEVGGADCRDTLEDDARVSAAVR